MCRVVPPGRRRSWSRSSKRSGAYASSRRAATRFWSSPLHRSSPPRRMPHPARDCATRPEEEGRRSSQTCCSAPRIGQSASRPFSTSLALPRNLKRFQDLNLNATARIWPRLFYTCHICSGGGAFFPEMLLCASHRTERIEDLFHKSRPFQHLEMF